jgi:excisionase family DNA binding protein
MQKLLTVREAADVLRVSAQSIRRLIKAREIPYVVVGQSTTREVGIRFDPETLNAWATGRTGKRTATEIEPREPKPKRQPKVIEGGLEHWAK